MIDSWRRKVFMCEIAYIIAHKGYYIEAKLSHYFDMAVNDSEDLYDLCNLVAESYTSEIGLITTEKLEKFIDDCVYKASRGGMHDD